MIKILLTIITVLLTEVTVAQEKKNFDFIIIIDGNIAKTVSNPEIIIKDDGKVIKAINVDYHPGSLDLLASDL